MDVEAEVACRKHCNAGCALLEEIAQREGLDRQMVSRMVETFQHSREFVYPKKLLETTETEGWDKLERTLGCLLYANGEMTLTVVCEVMSAFRIARESCRFQRRCQNLPPTLLYQVCSATQTQLHPTVCLTFWLTTAVTSPGVLQRKPSTAGFFVSDVNLTSTKRLLAVGPMPSLPNWRVLVEGNGKGRKAWDIQIYDPIDISRRSPIQYSILRAATRNRGRNGRLSKWAQELAAIGSISEPCTMESAAPRQSMDIALSVFQTGAARCWSEDRKSVV